jgi:hypothetical protein
MHECAVAGPFRSKGTTASIAVRDSPEIAGSPRPDFVIPQPQRLLAIVSFSDTRRIETFLRHSLPVDDPCLVGVRIAAGRFAAVSHKVTGSRNPGAQLFQLGGALRLDSEILDAASAGLFSDGKVDREPPGVHFT